MSKKRWFKIHSWLGFNLAIFMCFIGLTGTFALVSNELDWLSNPAKRVSPTSVENMNWLDVYSNAKQRLGQLPIRSIEAPIFPWFSAEVLYEKEDKQRHRLFFHPTTAEYLGDGRWLNWHRFFRMLHRHLMLPITLGVTLVGIVAVALFFIVLSSMYFYNNWWKGLFRFPNLNNISTRWSETHRLIGAWSVLFLLIISVTGCWYLAERWGAEATYPDTGRATTVEAMQKRIMPSAAQFSSMLNQVQKSFPSLVLQSIDFPRKAGQLVKIQGQAQAILVRPRANYVAYDPISAELITQQNGIDLTFHARISEAADPIHFGQWSGLLSKILHFIFGICLVGLSVTGVYMYGIRITRINRNDPTLSTNRWRTIYYKKKPLIILSTLVVFLFITYGLYRFY